MSFIWRGPQSVKESDSLRYDMRERRRLNQLMFSDFAKRRLALLGITRGLSSGQRMASKMNYAQTSRSDRRGVAFLTERTLNTRCGGPGWVRELIGFVTRIGVKSTWGRYLRSLWCVTAFEKPA